MAEHRCIELNRCHPCPDMGGEIMPWCWNGVIYGEMDGCLCDLPPTCKGCGGPLGHVEAARKKAMAALVLTSEAFDGLRVVD